MNQFTFFTFVILMAFLLISQTEQKCPTHINSQNDLLKLDLECFSENYNPDLHDGHKMARMIDQKVAGLKKIRQYLKMRNIKAIQTSPVIKWAQNEEQIFINFKLSHRQDSPPCSDVNLETFKVHNIENVTGKFEVKQIDNDSIEKNLTSGFMFTGQCYFTNQKFYYSLNMTFNATVDSINIERQGLGDYILVAEKNEKSIWIDPFEDVNRAAIWPQLRNRYESDMNKYFEMRQQRNEKNNQRKSKKRRKRRPTSQKNQNNQQQINKQSESQKRSDQL